MTTTFRRVYVILGIATVASFFGHAMWAVRGKDAFVELVTGSFNNVLGISIGTSTATNMVKAIGYWDIAISIVMAVAVIGFLQKSGPLSRFALSPVMVGVWVWAIFWSFATGASRMSGAGAWYPEVWDLVERGPNFLVPTAALLMTLFLRRQETLREAAFNPETLVIPNFADVPAVNGSRAKETVR